MLTIRFSETAEQHLEDIWLYTLNEWGIEQATQYTGFIKLGITQLLDNPYMGKARPEIKKELRSLQVQKHLVFYQVGTEYIDIIGILHSRMDIENRLN